MLKTDRFLQFSNALSERRKAVISNLLLCLCVLGLTIIPSRTCVIAQETEGSILVSVRDVETGYALPAFISISKAEQDGSTGPLIDSFQAPLGEILKTYPPGKYIIELKMEGYKPMKSWFVIEAGKGFRDRYMLSPIESKVEELQKKEQLEEKASPLMNMAMISGYITDDETGQPIEGVHIVFEKKRIETYSDQKGYYEATIPVEESMRLNDEEIKALQETIVFSLTGYKTLKEVNVLIPAGHQLKKNINLFKGEEEIIHDRRYKLFPPKKGKEFDKPRLNMEIPEYVSPPLDTTRANENKIEDYPNLMQTSTLQSLTFIQPPASIKVGFTSTWGCCDYKGGVTCSGVFCGPCTQNKTYDLETYVSLGWGDELGSQFITDCPLHSLRANAVAYRSYGAYYTLNKLSVNYDICSSCRCQMFDEDNEGLTSKKTAGIMLQKDGSIFFAQYSAENNNYPCSGGTCTGGDYRWISCGNGYVGRPTAWPCLYDPVGQDHTLSGHGGGMSQWGTCRWDYYYGKTWVWMVNHYYNANGGVDGTSSGERTAYMTSPLVINSASPTPSSVSRGQTFTININAQNYAGLNHEKILIGASLCPSGSTTNCIDDPANDTPVILYTGSNNISRLFKVPGGTASGTYDLSRSVMVRC